MSLSVSSLEDSVSREEIERARALAEKRTDRPNVDITKSVLGSVHGISASHERVLEASDARSVSDDSSPHRCIPETGRVHTRVSIQRRGASQAALWIPFRHCGIIASRVDVNPEVRLIGH